MKKTRLFSGILALLMGVVLCLGTVPASANDGNFELTIICRVNNVTLSDMEWTVYRAGEVNRWGYYELTGQFENLPVSVGEMITSEIIDTVSTLENYAVLYHYDSYDGGRTDENGELVLDGMEEGVYLLTGKSVEVDNVYYIPCAFLIFVTADSTYELVYPKYEIWDWNASVDGNATFTYTITKVWEDNDDASLSRSSSVSLDLYCDGVKYCSIVLDEENDWTYRWSASSYHDWKTIETDVPDDYTVVYRTDNKQFVVVNTLEDSTITTTAVTTDSGEETTTTLTDGGTIETGETGTTSGDTDENSGGTTTTKSGSSGGNVSYVSGRNSSGGGSSGGNSSSGGSSSGSSSSSTKLPQTGQLWWPVPVLAGVGLICLCIGCHTRKK